MKKNKKKKKREKIIYLEIFLQFIIKADIVLSMMDLMRIICVIYLFQMLYDLMWTYRTTCIWNQNYGLIIKREKNNWYDFLDFLAEKQSLSLAYVLGDYAQVISNSWSC